MKIVKEMTSRELLEVTKGARIFVLDFAKIKPGERLMILADDLADPFVVDLLAEIARDARAEVATTWIEHSSTVYTKTPEGVYEGLKKFDKLFRCTMNTGHHTLGLTRAMGEYGLSIYTLVPCDTDLLTSEAAKFPLELTYAIVKKSVQICRSAKTIRVTSEKGTDLTTELNPKNWGTYWGDWIEGWGEEWGPYTDRAIPGDTPGTFPPSACGTYPKPDTGNGVVYFDDMSSIGLIEEGEILKITFKDGWAVRIEGGEKAQRLEELLKPVQNSKHLAEIMFGTNPKSRINLKQEPVPLEAERHAGNTHIALGRALGAKYPAKTHFDGFVLKPTVYLDGKVLVDKGRLTVLDDPKIREMAKKYGDPDEVLAEKWEVIK